MTTWMPLAGMGLAIRMDLLNEEHAYRNHGQSLAKIAGRGGLDLQEALAIIEHRQWINQETKDTLLALIKVGSNVI